MNHTYSITPSREKGQHLTLSDRFSIQVYDRLCFSLRMIANELNCSPSTILNELHRGTGSRNGKRGRFPQYSANAAKLSMRQIVLVVTNPINAKITALSSNGLLTKCV